MTDDTPLPFDLPSVCRKKLTVDFAGGNQSSNAGLLLLRQAERELVVCRRLADAMPDRRDPDRIRHAMFEMVMERVAAIACGHEDAIDLDRLRHDPLMKVAVGRCPQSGAPLASQSTISRLENAPSKTEAARLCAALVRHDREARQVGDPRHRRHVLRGPWRPAARVLERASRRARLCVDAHLSRGERHAGRDHSAPGAHPEGHGGADSHQARDQAPEATLAEHPHRVAATVITVASRPWNGLKTTATTIFSASPAMRRSMRRWPRPPTICASIMPRAAKRSCAHTRASPTKPAVGTDRAK